MKKCFGWFDLDHWLFLAQTVLWQRSSILINLQLKRNLLAHFDGRKLATRTTFQNAGARANQFIKPMQAKVKPKIKDKKIERADLLHTASKGPRPSEARFFCVLRIVLWGVWATHHSVTDVWPTQTEGAGGGDERCRRVVKRVWNRKRLHGLFENWPSPLNVFTPHDEEVKQVT